MFSVGHPFWIAQSVGNCHVSYQLTSQVSLWNHRSPRAPVLLVQLAFHQNTLFQFGLWQLRSMSRYTLTLTYLNTLHIFTSLMHKQTSGFIRKQGWKMKASQPHLTSLPHSSAPATLSSPVCTNTFVPSSQTLNLRFGNGLEVISVDYNDLSSWIILQLFANFGRCPDVLPTIIWGVWGRNSPKLNP